MLRGAYDNASFYFQDSNEIFSAAAVHSPGFFVVIFLSVIAFSEGKNTASDLMAQNLVQIHNHIEERLNDDLTFVIVKIL